MALSNEDNLRLNVMLAQKPQAIRIDDSRMIVYALTEKGEAKVQLNPNCNEEKYLKQVRELLSTHFLGSPGGYPIYLRRWTRMGQERDDESLERRPIQHDVGLDADGAGRLAVPAKQPVFGSDPDFQNGGRYLVRRARGRGAAFRRQHVWHAGHDDAQRELVDESLAVGCAEDRPGPGLER